MYILQEIGQNQCEKGSGLILRHGHILRILRYMYTILNEITNIDRNSEMTYDINNAQQRKSRTEVTSAGLAHARPNYSSTRPTSSRSTL